MSLDEQAARVRGAVWWNSNRDAFGFVCDACGEKTFANAETAEDQRELACGCRFADACGDNRQPEDQPATSHNGAPPRSSPKAALTADRAEILRAVKLIAQPSGVHEIRALNVKGAGPTASGYFNSPKPLVDAVLRLDAEGIYITLNATDPALLARSKNALKAYAKHTTSDADILSRRWLPGDFDPRRKTGISSTDAEHEAAIERAKQAREFLTARGFPDPILGDSGNGAHLLYRVAEPNDGETAALFKRVLEALDSEFTDETVAVDRTNYNAGRIWKLYGTVARKGDSTPDRPHRLARILEAPEEPGIVSREQLEQLAALLPEPEPRANTYQPRDQFNLENFIAQHGIPIKRHSPWSNGERWVLEHCVFDPNHAGSSAAILRMTSSGVILYRCLHNGCAGRTWHDVRELFEPGYRDHRTDGSNGGRGAADDWLDDNEDDPWAAIQQVDEFLRASDAGANWLKEDILARESVTVFASPRGLGKTHLTYWQAIALALAGYRVLIIDRDNPKSEIKRRLRAWNATGLTDNGKLKIITRDKAPPLTDRRAWADFPYDDYDCVILDSITAATEGVEEGDGGKAGAGIAPLLDAARRGPAVLVLANTDKLGLKIRGSGTLPDRADIVFEIRDATDLKLEARHGVWWDALPDPAEHAWADRAKRRRRRDSYRLALVPSKFRLGQEPNPQAFEIRHHTEPWSVEEVTADIEEQLEALKRQAADAEQLKIDTAVKALKAALPLPKNPDPKDPTVASARGFLMNNHGFSRDPARRLIDDRIGRDWIQTGSGTKRDPFILKLSAGNGASGSPSQTGISETLFPAGAGAEGPPESVFKNATATRGSEPPISGGSFSFNDKPEAQSAAREGPGGQATPATQARRGTCSRCKYRVYDPARVFCPRCGHPLAEEPPNANTGDLAGNAATESGIGAETPTEGPPDRERF